MLTIWECVLIAGAVLPIAVHSALAARCEPSKLPWWQTIRRSECFGHGVQVTKHALMVTAWTLIGMAFTLSMAVLIRQAEGFVQKSYDYFGDPDRAHAGITTLLVGSLAMYLILIRRTRALAIRSLEVVDREVLERGPASERKDPLDSAIVSRDILRGKLGSRVHAKEIARVFISFAPLVLQPLYKYFYRRIGVIIEGSAFLLFEWFGQEEVKTFYDEVVKKTNDTRFGDLHRHVQSPELDRDSIEFAFLVLLAAVRVWGYEETRSMLDVRIRLRLISGQRKTRDAGEDLVMKSIPVDDGNGRRYVITAVSSDGEFVELSQHLHQQLETSVEFYQGPSAKRLVMRGHVAQRGHSLLTAPSYLGGSKVVPAVRIRLDEQSRAIAAKLAKRHR